MTSSLLIFDALAVAFIAGASGHGGEPQPSQEREAKPALHSAVDRKTTVRLFYNPYDPARREFPHRPLVFRVVEERDPRFNTAPLLEEGPTAYISLDEMRKLVQILAKSVPVWAESEKVEALGSYQSLLLGVTGMDAMEVLVVSSKGTGKARVMPKAVCTTVGRLDTALKVPRALWELQGFRLDSGCKVPGFKYGAYPNR